MTNENERRQTTVVAALKSTPVAPFVGNSHIPSEISFDLISFQVTVNKICADWFLLKFTAPLLNNLRWGWNEIRSNQ